MLLTAPMLLISMHWLPRGSSRSCSPPLCPKLVSQGYIGARHYLATRTRRLNGRQKRETPTKLPPGMSVESQRKHKLHSSSKSDSKLLGLDEAWGILSVQLCMYRWTGTSHLERIADQACVSKCVRLAPGTSLQILLILSSSCSSYQLLIEDPSRLNSVN